MIRHIFIATIKEGTPDEVVNQQIRAMRAMKESVPEMKDLRVGRSIGLAGPADTVTMTIDCDSEADFQKILASEAHQQVAANAGEAFRTDNFILSQITL